MQGVIVKMPPATVILTVLIPRLTIFIAMLIRQVADATDDMIG